MVFGIGGREEDMSNGVCILLWGLGMGNGWRGGEGVDVGVEMIIGGVVGVVLGVGKWGVWGWCGGRW